jgi:hypothetical protein
MEISAKPPYCFIFYKKKSNFKNAAHFLQTQHHTSIQDSISSYVCFTPTTEVHVPLRYKIKWAARMVSAV